MTHRVITFEDREAWLAARRQYIGSSDAAVLWNCGYASQSLYSLWASKCLGVEVEWSKSDLRRLRRGQIMESYIRELAAEELGVELQVDPPHSFRVNDRYPHMAASLDSWRSFVSNFGTETEVVPVELKSIGAHNAHEWENDSAPLLYQCQLAHQMLVCDSPFGYIVGLCDDELFVRRVERDVGWDGGHKELCRRFWEYVEAKQSPPVDSSDATTDAIKARWKRDDGPRVEVGDWLDDEAKRLDELADAEKAAKAAAQEIKNRIMDAIGDSEGCISPSGVEFTWKKSEVAEYVVPARVQRTLRRVGKKRSKA